MAVIFGLDVLWRTTRKAVPAPIPHTMTDIMTDAEMKWLIAPKTPAEAKRHWMIARLWAGSLLAQIVIIAITAALWLWPWPLPTAGQRINFLGLIALAMIGRQIITDWSFSIGGPVGRWHARWKDAEATAEGDNVVEAAYDGREP